MKPVTTNTVRVMTTALLYIIFIITASCVIDKQTCAEDAAVKTARYPKTNHSPACDNISTTGLVTLNGLQLL